MGSCLSKPSSKKVKKKSKEISLTEESNIHLQKQQPWITSETDEVHEEKEVSCVTMDDSPRFPSLSQVKDSATSLPSSVGYVKSDKPTHLPASPPVQKPSPSPSLSPDPIILPSLSGNTFMKKHSGELPTNPLRKPSSPCQSLLHNMPASPGLKKSILKNEEDECRFPSLARKQWLSQACVLNKGPEADDNTAEGSKIRVNKEKTLNNTESVCVPRSVASKELATELTGRMNRSGHETKAMASTGRASYNAEAKSVSSRTNSLSRDLSPIETSRAKARPSSPLKRSPSISAAEGPRLARSASGKVASPNRVGLHAADRHDHLKPRPHHKQSLSKEFVRDSSADISAHKRSSSRDSVSEFSADLIRKPSPPKRTPIIPLSAPLLSSVDTSKLSVKRPSTPVKESVPSHRSQEPSSIARGGRTPAQRNLSSVVEHEADNLTSSNNIRNTKRKEKSPLRRTCNGIGTLHSSTRTGDRNADLSINSDTNAARHFDLTVKDSSARTRKSGIRTPLKEITENSAKMMPSKQGSKDGHLRKTRNDLPDKKESTILELHSTEEMTRGHASFGTDNEDPMLDMAKNLSEYVKDPMEVKAESLVMGGKSVLSAFKALEEYRLKYSNHNSELHKDMEEDDAWYTRRQQSTRDMENLSQSLQGLEREKALQKANLQHQQAHELPRSRSAKKSCEQFLFPDVQSLLMSESEGIQLEGGLTMPASISKACSILRAVADLNSSTPVVYPRKKEVQDEIERPNLLSFQFGEGDSHRVTLS